MAYMTWSDELLTGNDEVDGQHKRLVELLNKLFEGMRTGKGADILGKVFDEILEYTDYHFKTEERLFGPVEYPEKEAHIEAHRSFVEKALDLQAKYRAGTAFVTIEVLDFLKKWVIEHISTMDLTFKDVI